ncbi:hypothetical protein J5491_00165 [Candidatus Saccharibacteria bacterium]|nr:hypothetical protein [Candidatus Saccharibacteria bacterium]
METLLIVLICVNSLILLVVGFMLVCIFELLKNGRTADEVRMDLREIFHEEVEGRYRELAYEYAEIEKLNEWLEAMMQQEEIDVDQLSEDSKKRIKALAIKNAESGIAIALADNDHLNQRISRVQQELNDNSSYEMKVESCKKELRILNGQTKHVAERIKSYEDLLESLKEL